MRWATSLFTGVLNYGRTEPYLGSADALDWHSTGSAGHHSAAGLSFHDRQRCLQTLSSAASWKLAAVLGGRYGVARQRRPWLPRRWALARVAIGWQRYGKCVPPPPLPPAAAAAAATAGRSPLPTSPLTCWPYMRGLFWYVIVERFEANWLACQPTPLYTDDLCFWLILPIGAHASQLIDPYSSLDNS